MDIIGEEFCVNKLEVYNWMVVRIRFIICIVSFFIVIYFLFVFLFIILIFFFVWV